MVVVAIDTSGRNGSVALCRGDGASFEVLGMTDIEGGTYSSGLVPCILELLAQAKLDKTQIEGFVVVDGPGSFTGLRVGLATVKGLCEVLQVPLATVSMLEALAVVHGKDGELMTTVLDAGRGEVYVGEYRINGQHALLETQSIVKLVDLATQMVDSPARVVTTIGKLPGASAVEPLQADAIGRIGLRKLLAGEVADRTTLDANYIRRSDAELFSLPK